MKRFFSTVAAIFVAMSAVADEHEKIDIATTSDGATYIGEIKGVQYATLKLDTHPAGLVDLEWRYLTSLESKYRYRIRLAGGDLKIGTLGTPSKSGLLNIVGDAGSFEIGLDQIVEISPFEHGFWERLDGSISFGMTYTKSNEALQYNFGGQVSYRRPKGYAQLSAQSIFNNQKGADSSEQHSLNLVLTHPGKNEWGWFEVGKIQSKPDQGFDFRSIIGGGISNFLIEQSAELLLLNLGVVYNREDVTSSSEVDNSAEAVAGLSYRHYKTSSHSPNLQVNLEAIKALSGQRFRATLDFIISWKIVNNFTFNFQISDSYDSEPPGTESVDNDISVLTSIGYTF